VLKECSKSAFFIHYPVTPICATSGEPSFVKVALRCQSCSPISMTPTTKRHQIQSEGLWEPITARKQAAVLPTSNATPCVKGFSLVELRLCTVRLVVRPRFDLSDRR